jgi:glycine amidinotransferase
MPHENIVVNSWNEWDPLTHVIVGLADGTMVQAPEPAVCRDWPEHGFPKGRYGPLPEEMVAAANEELDHFADLLRRRGIRVDRPTPVDFAQRVGTPDWTQDSMFGCMPPRDLLITVGNEILEATMSYRSRWHEYLCYRPLLQEYYRSDPDMRWEAAPKPRLTDDSYHAGFWAEYEALPTEEKLVRVRRNDLLLTEVEPLFDAADIARCGRDLFVQLSLVTNRSGARWLRQHFPNHRVHEVVFDDVDPVHIDGTFIPLRPGLALSAGERRPEEELVGYFKTNGWEIVEAAKPARTYETLPNLCFCSPWLSVNVLILDQKTVCVDAGETAQMDLLDRHGFEVVPVPFTAVAPFGGGLHCATVDVHREGGLEDYFPRPFGRFGRHDPEDG